MSLFGSIQLGGNTLQAMQIGLQVTGNNIANANTPGFIRQEAVYKPAPVQNIGGLVLGLGVEVDGIVQKIDKFVQDRLVSAKGDRAGADIQQNAYNEVETVLNGLSGTTDLSTVAHHVCQFDPRRTRRAKQRGHTQFGDQQRRCAGQEHHESVHPRDKHSKGVQRPHRWLGRREINTLTTQISKLNVQIATVEGGGSSASDAGGLRVQRQAAIDRLSEIASIKVVEQPSGGVNISVGGDYLVFEGQRREVEVNQISDNGTIKDVVEFSATKSPFVTTSGELAGEYAARDQISGDFLNGLDKLTSIADLRIQ